MEPAKTATNVTGQKWPLSTGYRYSRFYFHLLECTRDMSIRYTSLPTGESVHLALLTEYNALYVSFPISIFLYF